MVFTGEEPVDSFVDDSNLSKTVQDQFNGMCFSEVSCHYLPTHLGFSYNGSHLP